MKKKSLSQILALGLTAVMTTGMLAGCGNDDGAQSSGSSSESPSGGYLRNLLLKPSLRRSLPRKRAARRRQAEAAKCPR